ncbi:oligopeptide ABC transporter permease [Paenibacillus thermotolerans]|uniref:oligopeptide ABC transporter permease n=1 Tax=Paenibacillus thermotolerans TaxID=3027807 RepID=UPI002368E907|nr:MULTISPECIES: oligopeptide ABC transporter permease [unclassified Paenibacillus]
MSLPNPAATPANGPQVQNDWSMQGKIESRGAAIWKRYKKNKLAVAGLVVISIYILLAICAPLFSEYNPEGLDLMNADMPPSLSHPFGTDSLGGDVFIRSLYGARVSLTVAFVAMVITVAIGVSYGAVSGYFGGVVDAIMMRIVDALQSIPSFFLLLIIAAIMTPSLWSTILAISLLGWMSMARIVRSEILSLRQRDYAVAAIATGETKPSIIFYHILPNAIAPIIVIATLDVAGNILYEATLSFLGLGIQPPTPSWGNMLSAAQELVTLTMYPWVAVFPGLFIMIAVLSVNFIGDGLRDALDPKMKDK